MDRRFRECGEAGPVDRREENGTPKLDDSRLEHGWRRPTWIGDVLVFTF